MPRMTNLEYLNEARRLYCYENKSIIEISKILPININTLYQWKNKYGFDAERIKYLRKQKNALEILEMKIEELLTQIENTNVFDIMKEDIEKLRILKDTYAAIKKAETTVATSLTVMNSFAEFVAKNYPDSKELIAKIIRDYFNSIEGTKK